MIKTLVRVVGVLLALGGLAAGWMGFETIEEIRQLDQEIEKERSQMANPGARPGAKEAGEKIIAESEQAIEKKKTQRNLWFGAAAVAFVAGLVMALLPSSRKRKAPARPAPAPNPDAPGP